MTTQTIGSRRQVWNGTAKKTSGGLTKSDLVMSRGHIVSKAKHISAKKEMRLLKYGYGTKKGKFGYVKIGTKKNRRKQMKGGHTNIQTGLSPTGIDGEMIMDYDSNGSNNIGRGGGASPFANTGSASWNGDAPISGGGKKRRHRRKH